MRDDLHSRCAPTGFGLGSTGSPASVSRWVGSVMRALFWVLAVGWIGTPSPAAESLVWRDGPGYRVTEVHPAPDTRTGFTLLSPAQSGISFSNLLSTATMARNRLLEIGSGVALGDVDHDGLVDLYFCRLEGPNVLYRNLGNWKFEDVTAKARVACPDHFSTGAALVDSDGDGDLDLFVTSLGNGTRLFLNDGHGQFTESADSGLVRRFGATSMAFGDIDGDGNIDMYVANYRTDTFFDNPPGLKINVGQTADGKLIAEPRQRVLALAATNGRPLVVERGEPDILYLNAGQNQFRPVPWQVGLFVEENGQNVVEPPTDWGLSVMFRDLNSDGSPDLYVCNDFIHWPDRLWLNDSGKRLRAVPRPALRHLSLASMTVDVADINRDGWDDIFVADMMSPSRTDRARQRPDLLQGALLAPNHEPYGRPEIPRNTLQLARGNGSYAEIAALAGLAATDWTTCAVFLDVDLDGWEDLLLSAGNLHDVQDADAMGRAGKVFGWQTSEKRALAFHSLRSRAAPSLAFRNQRDLTFKDLSKEWGFGQTGIAHGMALADLDNDGDLDVVVNAMNEPARLYRNDSPAPRIGVRLKGAAGNTRGLGARIHVLGGPVTQSQEMMAGGRFCSSDEAMRTFATGEATQLEVHVKWRSGKLSVISNAAPNSIYEIAESAATAAPTPARSKPDLLFEDVSTLLAHTHFDMVFDDFSGFPLLPHKLSTLGPGIAWVDLDEDGFDDLLIAGGKGGHMAVYLNDRRGRFSEWRGTTVAMTNAWRQTALVAARGEGPGCQVVVGQSGWGEPEPKHPPLRVWNLPSGETWELPAFPRQITTGPVAMADVDGDGDLDLFVGGRAVPNRYPELATSFLLKQERETYTVMQSFAELGLVSGAVFADFDGDGQPDLALACEWDSLRLFKNDKGNLTEVTAALGLGPFKGFWNGVAVGDFDNDGRLDLVASNWGRNWRIDQPPGTTNPVKLIYGDFVGDGTVQTLLASLDPGLGKLTPWRERSAVAAVIPALVSRAPDHQTYGRMSVSELLGSATPFRELEAGTFDSMLFLNRGNHFEPKPLPIEAQFAPAFGISVADFDGDGNEDLFLAQNFFGVDAETARHDSGVGSVLLGQGNGSFRSLRPLESGIAVYGEQRGTAVADFDCDGRTDLALTQHAGPTRLYRNRRATPGVRVTLRDRAANRSSIGAVVRLVFPNCTGPARAVHAGCGFLSQDSSTLVLAAPTNPVALLVRWPGGKNQRFAWPLGATAVEVSAEGIRIRPFQPSLRD